MAEKPVKKAAGKEPELAYITQNGFNVLKGRYLLDQQIVIYYQTMQRYPKYSCFFGTGIVFCQALAKSELFFYFR